MTFKLGWLNPQAGVEGLDQEVAGAVTKAKALGGTVISLNINSNPQTQAADFRQLLAQHVTAIVLQPIDPPALAPLLKQATAAGIPVVAVTTPADSSLPNLPGYVTNVTQGPDSCAYHNVSAVAHAKPHATYALITSDIPFPVLQVYTARVKYWASRFGLQYVGGASTGSSPPTPAAGSTAMASILAQHPSVTAVFAWTDGTAEGAAALQKSRAGGHVMVLGQNGEKAAQGEISQGTMFGTCKEAFTAIGEQAATGAYLAQTKQHVPLTSKVAPPVLEITRGGTS